MAKLGKRVGTAAGTAIAAVAYAGPLRRWMHDWGATEEEVKRAMPGELVMERSGSGYRYTWAIALFPRERAGTRLVSRYRYVGSKALLAVAEPIVFAFMRAWLSHVRARAERGPRA